MRVLRFRKIYRHDIAENVLNTYARRTRCSFSHVRIYVRACTYGSELRRCVSFLFFVDSSRRVWVIRFLCTRRPRAIRIVRRVRYKHRVPVRENWSRSRHKRLRDRYRSNRTRGPLMRGRGHDRLVLFSRSRHVNDGQNAAFSIIVEIPQKKKNRSFRFLIAFIHIVCPQNRSRNSPTLTYARTVQKHSEVQSSHSYYVDKRRCY